MKPVRSIGPCHRPRLPTAATPVSASPARLSSGTTDIPTGCERWVRAVRTRTRRWPPCTPCSCGSPAPSCVAGATSCDSPAELDDLADQSADDALLAITAKLGEFRGESRFTTWAYMFVILEVSNKIGRHFCCRPTVTMETDDWDRLPDRLGMGPPEAAQHQDLLVALRRAVDEELSEHQRQVFTAIVVDGIPVDALAVRLGSNRNALYKTMFDARRKIRAALVANGYLDIMRTPSPDAPASIQAARRR